MKACHAQCGCIMSQWSGALLHLHVSIKFLQLILSNNYEIAFFVWPFCYVFPNKGTHIYLPLNLLTFWHKCQVDVSHSQNMTSRLSCLYYITRGRWLKFILCMQYTLALHNVPSWQVVTWFVWLWFLVGMGVIIPLYFEKNFKCLVTYTPGLLTCVVHLHVYSTLWSGYLLVKAWWYTFTSWFKHILFITRHDNRIGQSKKLCLVLSIPHTPLHLQLGIQYIM